MVRITDPHHPPVFAVYGEPRERSNTCNFCRKQIVGLRYESASNDFTLCEACERDKWRNDFLMVKIYHPAKAPDRRIYYAPAMNWIMSSEQPKATDDFKERLLAQLFPPQQIEKDAKLDKGPEQHHPSSIADLPIDWKEFLTNDEYVSRLFYFKYFPNKLVFTDSGTYCFNNFYWKLLQRKEDYHKLFAALSRMSEYCDGALHQGARLPAGVSEAAVKARIALLTTEGFCKKVILGCTSFAYLTDKDVAWNPNPNCFQFKNATYDLLRGKWIACEPGHRINHSCGYPFRADLVYTDRSATQVTAEFSRATSDVKKFLDATFSGDGFPSSGQKLNALTALMASFLTGGNRGEVAHFFLGSQGTNKIVLESLLRAALGNYFGSIPLAFEMRPRPPRFLTASSLVVIFNLVDEEPMMRENPTKYQERAERMTAVFSSPLYQHAFLCLLLDSFRRYHEGVRDGSYKRFLLHFTSEKHTERSNKMQL